VWPSPTCTERPLDDPFTGLIRNVSARTVTATDLGELLRRALAAYNQRDFARATAICKSVIEHEPGNFGAHSLLGAIAILQGAHAEAVDAFGKALEMKPEDINARFQRGRALAALGELGSAVADFRSTVAMQPAHADAWLQLALALKATGDAREAQVAYERSLELRRDLLATRSDDFAGRYALSKEYQQMGDMASALALCREALSINPQHVPARGALAHYQVQTIYDSVEDIAASRAAFAAELDKLRAWLDTVPAREAYMAFETTRVFFLAYQEQSNLELLSTFGAFCARTMARWQVAVGLTEGARPRGDKLRLGVVLAHARPGPVWDTLVRGWLEHLDRNRFDVCLFTVEPTYAPRKDGGAEQKPFAQHHVVAAAADFVDLSPLNLHESARAILDRGMDVLVYPEVGINRKVAVLASLRLARVQAASWGHPETTGLPTIDYFLSAQALEPSEAERNYTERLVKLPGLGCCYMPVPAASVELDLQALGVDPARPVLVCPGTPFKYAPQFDDMLIQIATRLPLAQLVFFQYERLFYTRKLKDRLRQAFRQRGMNMDDHIVFVPWLDASRFVALLAQSTLMLDTIGFSGFNTAMRAVESALPIVTREGRFMRGRLAAGILRAVDLSELIVPDEASYVELTVKLATDAQYNASVRERMAQRRRSLYEDVSAVQAFERFCVEAAGLP